MVKAQYGWKYSADICLKLQATRRHEAKCHGDVVSPLARGDLLFVKHSVKGDDHSAMGLDCGTFFFW